MKVIFIYIIIFSTFLFGQVENSQNLNRNFNSPKFYIDVANYKNLNSNKTKLDVFVQVPYSTIQFIKTVNGFEAGFSVTFTLYENNSDKILTERIWNEKVVTKQFDETSSEMNFYLSHKTLELEPGTYKLRCIVEDKDSRNTFSFENPLNVINYSDSLALSDILLILSTSEDKKQKGVIPNVSRNIISQNKELNFYYEIYSPVKKTYPINYKIMDESNNVIFNKVENVTVDSIKHQVFYSIPELDYQLGIYNLYVQILDENEKPTSGTKKSFYSKMLGLPGTITDLDAAIEQMVYIASAGVIDSIQEKTNFNDKLKAFQDFWKSQDPSPTTPQNEVFMEYYRRVAYSNQYFKGYSAGWRSDMGMVYITLGPPNNVERHPIELNSKPYEVWDYYDLNRSFIFVDQTGFGDYRLYNPQYGDWFRFR